MSRRDNRLFAQITLDYLDSHKIAILSDAAVVAHLRMILWCKRMLNDGVIPEKMALHLAKRSRVLTELCTNDVDAPSLTKVGSDYILHDFVFHQGTRADVEEKSRINTENGRLGGRPRRNRTETEPVTETEPKKSQRQTADTETDKPSSTKKVVSASRIPEPFMVTAKMREWAAREVPGLDVDWVTRNFVDYWRAASGRTASKLDWVAAWQYWLRTDFGKRAKVPARLTPEERARQTLALAHDMKELQ